jgi:molecular chaperone GrpE
MRQLTGTPIEKSIEPSKEAKDQTSSYSDQMEQLRNQLKEATSQRQENEKKAKEYLDRIKRLQADMENLQKITKRQVETVTRQASERLLLKLLPSLDALREAEKVSNSGNPLPPQEIAVGLRMLEQQLSDVLRSEGIEEITAVGQPLDPERHEVVSFVETDEKPENTITEEIRKGYMMNGKVIRPSIVVVSKKTHAKEEEPAGDTAE